MNDMTSPITRQEYEDACAAARKNPSLLIALRADSLTPTTFSCEPGDKLFKVFGIAARLDALEAKMVGPDLSVSGSDTADFINRARTRAGAANVVIGPSAHGKFRNSDGTVNLSEVLDAECEAEKE